MKHEKKSDTMAKSFGVPSIMKQGVKATVTKMKGGKSFGLKTHHLK